MNSLEVEEVINPYRTIKQWKLLTVIIIIGLTSFIFMGASGVTGALVMMGELQGALARHNIAYAIIYQLWLYFFWYGHFRISCSNVMLYCEVYAYEWNGLF